jgi:hypothetical protein
MIVDDGSSCIVPLFPGCFTAAINKVWLAEGTPDTMMLKGACATHLPANCKKERKKQSNDAPMVVKTLEMD